MLTNVEAWTIIKSTKEKRKRKQQRKAEQQRKAVKKSKQRRYGPPNT